jgi:hypothetical protein
MQPVLPFSCSCVPSQLQPANVEDKQLRNLIEEAAKKLAAAPTPIEHTRHIAEILTLEKLQDAIRTKFPAHKDAVATAKEMVEEARYFLSKTDDNPFSITTRTRLSDLFDSLLSILEGLISAFGIGEFFKPAESELHAQCKAQQLMGLFYQFSFLNGLLESLCGDKVPTKKIVGGFLFSMAVISLLYPHIRPMPSYLPGRSENWSQQVRHGQFNVVDGRKVIRNTVAQTLINGTTMPLLVGETGVGKTKLAKALVQAIERGDYPELRGKEVFYYNCADLVNNTEMYTAGGNRILPRISQAMGRHRQNIILIFDEVHMLCPFGLRDSAVLAEQLKTLLDSEGPDRLPYVIGITTETEFARYIASNGALVRRFTKIPVTNTEEQETEGIFNGALLKRAPEVIVDPTAFQTVWDQTQKRVQPAAALEVLVESISKTSPGQVTPIEKTIENVAEKIEALYSKGAISNSEAYLPYRSDPSNGVERRDQIAQLHEQLRTLEENLRKEKTERAAFFQLRNDLVVARKEMFQMVLKIAKLSKDCFSAQERNEQSTFLLLSHFVIPALDTRVKSEAKKLNITTVIDRELVTCVIKERKEREDAALRLIVSGTPSGGGVNRITSDVLL